MKTGLKPASGYSLQTIDSEKSQFFGQSCLIQPSLVENRETGLNATIAVVQELRSQRTNLKRRKYGILA
ncbi:hypothetical protein [Tychonema sp. BBK16]|uniref:hypothetical protein n=1 Tax=Tychonema sp. BBK16 TaxID=2699888 RepID=UPI001F37B3A3|nr:hypothetical protein [Tychonema sp. BBK16]MCF6374882.1 hypothetical protein [Tychonema sp. BBK16]